MTLTLDELEGIKLIIIRNWKIKIDNKWLIRYIN